MIYWTWLIGCSSWIFKYCSSLHLIIYHSSLGEKGYYSPKSNPGSWLTSIVTSINQITSNIMYYSWRYYWYWQIMFHLSIKIQIKFKERKKYKVWWHLGLSIYGNLSNINYIHGNNPCWIRDKNIFYHN